MRQCSRSVIGRNITLYHMPKAHGKHMLTTCFVDADHARFCLTCCSHCGVFDLCQQGPNHLVFQKASNSGVFYIWI
jgi:hypothetical protein